MTSDSLSDALYQRAKVLIGAAKVLWRMRGFIVRVNLNPEGIKSFVDSVDACDECSGEFRPDGMCEAHREQLEYWVGDANLGESR